MAAHDQQLSCLCKIKHLCFSMDFWGAVSGLAFVNSTGRGKNKDKGKQVFRSACFLLSVQNSCGPSMTVYQIHSTGETEVGETI